MFLLLGTKTGFGEDAIKAWPVRLAIRRANALIDAQKGK